MGSTRVRNIRMMNWYPSGHTHNEIDGYSWTVGDFDELPEDDEVPEDVPSLVTASDSEPDTSDDAS